MDKCMPKGGCKGKGFVILVLGVLFLLGTMGVWPEFTFMTYWPLFLIFGGLHKVCCPCKADCGPKGEEMGGSCCKK